MASQVHLLAFNRGDHICLFYRDLDDFLSTATPYIELGLRRKERCYCVLPEEMAHALRADLQSAGVDTGYLEQNGALQIDTPETGYQKDGGFDCKGMTRKLENAVRESLALGFDGFRAMGDLSWAAKDQACCSQLPAYEALMAEFYPSRPALGLCLYDTRIFEEKQLEELMKSHQISLTSPEPTKRSIRLRRGKMVGDIIFDRSLPSLYHYAVLEDTSSEFLLSGQDNSLMNALSTVKSALGSH